MVATRGDPARRQAAACTSDHQPEKASQSARYLLFHVESASTHQKSRQREQGESKKLVAHQFSNERLACSSCRTGNHPADRPQPRPEPAPVTSVRPTSGSAGRCSNIERSAGALGVKLTLAAWTRSPPGRADKIVRMATLG